MRTTRLIAVLTVLAALRAPADIVHLRNGGRIEGRVTDRGTSIEIDTGSAKLVIDKADVEKIEPKPVAPAPGKAEGSAPADDAAPKPGPSKVEGPPPRARLGDPYAHPFLGFLFRPPLGWASGEASAGAAASFYGPVEKFYVPRIDIIHVRLGEGDMLDDFTSKWKASHERTFPGWGVISEELTGIRGTLGTRLVTRLGGNPPPLKNLSIILWSGRRAFVLSFTTGSGYYDRLAPLVERSFATFRVLAEPAIDDAQRKAFQDRYNAAAASLAAGRREEALAGFRACAAIVPGFADLQRAIGSVCAELGRAEEAVAAYRKAVALDPEHADAHYNLGTLQLREEKAEEAVKALKKAVALEPEHERAWINLGAAHVAREAWAEARAALERGCLLAPDSVAGHLALGRVYERLKEPARAAREYRDVLQLEPGHAGAAEALRVLGEK
jgi:Flp pilus assembly protein TadD